MKKLQRSVYILLFICLSVSLLAAAREFLIPVVLAGILAMLFIQFCNVMEQKGMHRGISALIAVFTLIISVSIIVSLLSWQISGLAENVEGMKERALSFFQNLKEWINESLGISASKQDEIIKQQGKDTSGQAGNMLAGFISGTLGILINTVLVMVYLYLFLYYRSRIRNFIIKLVPSQNEDNASLILQKSTKVSQKYLSGLALMIVILWIMYGIGFTIVGVENAIFFAILCGILEIVPFVGNITGTSIAVLAVMVQGGDSKMIIGVIVVYLIVQFIQTYLLEPLVVGDQVNINPLFTIMVLAAGELIWGIAGMVLAIPLLGIVKIICDNIPDLKPYGYLIGTDKKKKTGILEKLKGIKKK